MLLDNLRCWIPGASVVENIGSELTIMLPVGGNELGQCLNSLDVQQHKFGVATYGIFDTTLEEVCT